MQQELVSIYQFLYHVTPVVAFQVKSWSDFRTLPMICKLSPVEVSPFQRKNGPQTENVYYLESFCQEQKDFFNNFLILKIPDPW